jgi:sulfur carrier protein ThiS
LIAYCKRRLPDEQVPRFVVFVSYPNMGRIPLTVKLVLRNKEYEVRSGMTLRDSLLKVGITPEAILATRQGQMLTEDEILKDGDVIKLIAVISGGRS